MSQIQSNELKSFLEREKDQQRANTFNNRKTGLKAFDTWLQSTGLGIDDVTFEDVEDFANWLTNERGNGGISDQSANLYIQQVSLFYKRKIKKELIAQAGGGRAKESDIVTPVDNAELNLNLTESERQKHTHDRDRKGLTVEQMESMIEAADTFKVQLILKIFAGTGCRPSDLKELRVQDVNLEEKRVKIRSTKTTNSRKVPISDSLKEYLNLWTNHGYRDGCYYAETTDYLIPGDQSEKIGDTFIQNAVNTLADEIGIQEDLYTDGAGRTRKKYNPKSFRVGYITHMKDKVTPKELQYLAGHKDIETTLNFYTEITDDDLDRMQTKVPDI